MGLAAFRGEAGLSVLISNIYYLYIKAARTQGERSLRAARLGLADGRAGQLMHNIPDRDGRGKGAGISSYGCGYEQLCVIQANRTVSTRSIRTGWRRQF